MMHFRIGLVGMALIAAGCATSPGESSSSAPTASRDVTATCDATHVRSLVGNSYSERLASDARRNSGAGDLRVVMPGQVMTMEYRPERLTIVVDDDGNVRSVRCG